MLPFLERHKYPALLLSLFLAVTLFWLTLRSLFSAQFISAFLLLLGALLLLLFSLLLFWHFPSFSPQEFERRHLGLIVSSQRLPTTSFRCQHCQKQFLHPPIRRDDEIFCSLECEKKTRHQAEREKKFVFRDPLSPTELQKKLTWAIQLAERARRSANEGIIDEPLLQLARQQRGVSAIVQEVISSLLLFGEYRWAKELYLSPPPEPTNVKGVHKGTPNFFAIAKKILHESPKLAGKKNPLTLLKITEMKRKDLKKWLAKDELTPQEKQALKAIEEAFASLEQLYSLSEKQHSSSSSQQR